MSEADAPGKLVIAGEYAVLHGAPAIAIAVNVRARARVGRSGGLSRLVVPDGGSWEFQWGDDGQPQWQVQPVAGQGNVLEAVLAVASRRVLLAHDLPALMIELDTREFHRARADGFREKLGLGSSAAVTVALAGALLAELGATPERGTLLGLALDAHHELQGGAGSGIDVIAALYGGVVGIGAPEAPEQALSLSWPTGLDWLAAWTGCAASTRVMLERLEKFRTTRVDEFNRQLSVLKGSARAVLASWRRGRVAAILAALADYGDALRSLDGASGIGIWTPAHDRLAALAAETGAVYKPSGAGGGDFGIAFASTAEPLRRLQARLVAEGVDTIAGGQAAPGVRIEGIPPTRQ